MTKIFLSYDSDDRRIAGRVAAALEQAGHDVWWDRHIRGGAEFAPEIDQALQDAEAVVVLWSKESIASPWVRDEAAAGRDSRRFVPVRIDECTPPLGFRQYQTIDLAGWRRTQKPAELEDLLQALEPNDAARKPVAVQRSAGSISRRKVLAGAGALAAAGIAGGGYLLHRRESRPNVPPEVETLMVQAKQLMDQAGQVSQNQAIGLYERAVKLAPDYPDAWGRLGLICAICSHYRERPEALALRAKAVSAASHALQLDSSNVYGEMALAIARPFIGHWAEWDDRMTRALATEPRNDDLLTYRAVMLQFEGRAAESVPLYQRIAEKPFRPAVYNNYIKALWTAGRAVELDDAMNDAASLYPTQPIIWFTRFQILAFGGRADAAIGLAQNVEGRPPDLDDQAVSNLVKLARAIASHGAAEVDSVIADQMKAARVEAAKAEISIRNASALGRIDDAFTIADAYYFGRGFTVPDYAAPGSAFSPEQRQTRLLFEPVTAPMRVDRRFEPLVREIGFDRYWRQSGQPPDYRRASAQT